MKNSAIAAGLGIAAGIAIGGWLAFREMSTVIVGTVEQYRAQTRVETRGTQARPKRRQRPSGRDPIDPQTETAASCLCAQRLSKGEQRVPCPIHGETVFDTPIAAV